MKRRSVIQVPAAAALGAALPAFAQTQRVMRMGVLSSMPANHPFQIEIDKQFYACLKLMGWEAGRNLLIDNRVGLANPELHLANAKALVEAKVDMIVTSDDISTYAAFQAIKTIPIVFSAAAAVEFGYAKSLSRPGGNMTGVVHLGLDLAANVLEMLREIRPGLNKAGYSSNFEVLAGRIFFANMQAAGQKVGVTFVQLPDVRDMAGIEPMLAAAKREGVQALSLTWRGFLAGEGLRRIRDWAIENKVLTYSGNWQRGELLMSWGPNIPKLIEVSCRQIDLVLRGGNPAEMPIEQPTHFDWVISKKIAREMGLTIPLSVLLRATEVIE